MCDVSEPVVDHLTGFCFNICRSNLQRKKCEIVDYCMRHEEGATDNEQQTTDNGQQAAGSRQQVSRAK